MTIQYEDDLLDFIAELSTHDPLLMTADDCRLIRYYVHSDGCTNVPDIDVQECQKHDFYYRTHHDFEGKLITRKISDARYRRGIQNNSRFGVFSPMSWWRWAGVRLFGHHAWNKRGSCHG